MFSLSEAWKWDLRKKVWNFLEDNDLADFPRPVHHRIPNFKGFAKAGERLAELPEFINAKVVKVNPDTPQKSVRVAALRSEKSLDSFNRYYGVLRYVSLMSLQFAWFIFVLYVILHKMISSNKKNTMLQIECSFLPVGQATVLFKCPRGGLHVVLSWCNAILQNQ